MGQAARIIGTLAAGVAVGFVVARWTGSSAPVAGDAPVGGSSMTPPPCAAHEPAGPADATPSPPARAAAASPGPAPAVTAAASNETATAASAVPDAEYTGYSQPVEAGPVFRKIMAAPSPPGAENRLAQMHRALEREVRDDSWAYPMEAEIQNSLVAETSAGRLTVEHLECRATLCELRLSGIAANEPSLSSWIAASGKQPWASRLYMNLSSTITDGERVDSLLIFRRPG
jgi:hypothetical protein